MAKLFVVPTPVGNLEDITFRAVRILKEVSLILAEDTRTTGFLLKHLGIQCPMASYHMFNEHRKTDSLIQRILASGNVALVSDAGTPSISDPGFLLIRECLAIGIEVECLPGPTALIPALVNSGLPSDRFIFEGFLPRAKGRKTRLTALAGEERTLVFYESPFRLVKTLDELSEYFGTERLASVSREISKLHEENRRGTLKELADYWREKTVKGEICIVVEGKGKKSVKRED
jgi:16S rRNA (cytidine1402-2'-O)-methyltransferase